MITKLNHMELIKKLREKTGTGIVDCQKALAEAQGDFNLALEIIRKKGIARAAKRSERTAAQGLIKACTNSDQTEGYMIEVNSETDFVARNERFQNFVQQLLTKIRETKPKSFQELLVLKLDDTTVQETLDNLSGVIGEKLAIKDFVIISSAGTVAAYLHPGGKVGVLMAINEKNKDLAKNLAMQVAAMDPKYISPEEIPADEIAKEKAIYREQLLKTGKPEIILEKIITGKLAKFYEALCLIKQEYIKDDKKKVADILAGAKIEKFIRYSL